MHNAVYKTYRRLWKWRGRCDGNGNGNGETGRQEAKCLHICELELLEYDM